MRGWGGWGGRFSIASHIEYLHDTLNHYLMSDHPSLSEILASADSVESMMSAPEIVLVDNKYVSNNDIVDVMMIQSIIGLLNRSSHVTMVWDSNAAKTFAQSPSSFPILACFVLHANVKNVLDNDEEFPIKIARININQTRLTFDWFSEPKILLCADHLGLGRQRELYLSKTSTGIRPREHFEALVYPYIETRLAVSVSEQNAFKWRAALTSIVFELFENTDLHGRTDWQGKVLQSSIRGILFKDVVAMPYQARVEQKDQSVKCLEIGIFDSGVGYFCKNRKAPLNDDVTLKEEWDVLHQCLSTHLEDGVSPNLGKGQRGIGLYEVLRALKFLNGAIEFRTGRLHAYRSFLPGDLLLQMESKDSKLRPNMPKPTLLDYSKKYLAIPSQQSTVVGSAVRVLIPLG